MKTRASWDDYFMTIARAVATRATCDRKHVGAVIVRDREILASGYNGSIRGQPHCDDKGHLMEDGHCRRTVHAEASAILQAAKHGHAVDGATLYTTASPCWDCFKLIVNAGIMCVVFGEAYRAEDPGPQRVIQVAREAGVELVPLTVVTMLGGMRVEHPVDSEVKLSPDGMHLVLSSPLAGASRAISVFVPRSLETPVAEMSKAEGSVVGADRCPSCGLVCGQPDPLDGYCADNFHESSEVPAAVKTEPTVGICSECSNKAQHVCTCVYCGTRPYRACDEHLDELDQRHLDLTGSLALWTTAVQPQVVETVKGPVCADDECGFLATYVCGCARCERGKPVYTCSDHRTALHIKHTSESDVPSWRAVEVVKGPVCDECKVVATYECMCRRCDREGANFAERYYACVAHRSAVDMKHVRVRGREVEWKKRS